jgi:hypothetical protein
MLPDIQQYGEDPVPVGNYWLRQVDSRFIPKLWPELRKVLLQHSHLWDTEHTIESLYGHFRDGSIQLWVIGQEEGAYMYFVTTITEYPAGKVFEIVLGVGSNLFDFLVPSIEYLKHYAAVLGCTGFEILGRPGWMRPLKKLGFDVRSVRMRTSVKLERIH